MRVVLTRPQEDSDRTATALRAKGHYVLIAPLLRVEPVDARLTHSWGGIVITSAHAVAAIASSPARDALIKLPLYAVGKRTADAARDVGFTDIVTAGGDVRDLLRNIVARRADDKGPLLYLAGEDRSGDLIGDLAVRGIAAEMAVVYRAAVAPFSPVLIDALKAGEADAVLHFSKRSAESYLAGAEAAQVTAQALAIRHLCLSAQIAAPLEAAGATRVVVAKRPDEAAMIELVTASKD
jgi:uroporphyrinogen-III synthase